MKMEVSNSIMSSDGQSDRIRDCKDIDTFSTVCNPLI